MSRLETWIERSRLNPVGLLRMPWPDLSRDDTAAMDRLLGTTPPGAEVPYDLPQPKWIFLHHLARSGQVLSGSNELDIEEFRTRANRDAHNRPIEAAFATDDAIWAMYFAVVRREGNTYGYINWCCHVRNESRYLFSIGRDPKDAVAWTEGMVYVLPRDTYAPTPDSRELVSLVPVRPRARLRVEPDDFPFRHRTMQHGEGDTPLTVTRRSALRRHR